MNNCFNITNIIFFNGQPNNYKKINNSVSRSAQPKKDDFKWLKEQGVTDVINFRTMKVSGLDFDEKVLVENNGMKYHSIPSIPKKPTEENVGKFLDIVDKIEKNGGKVHIHCKAGADRTGMYAWIYKQIHNIGTMGSNKKEMLKMGHHYKAFPHLISWIQNFLNKKRIGG